MKNVLIPTDFTLESLENIGRLAENLPKEKLNIRLVHFIKLSDSMSELLLLSQRTKEHELITDEFILQADEWRRKYGSQIQSVQVTCFYGSTVAVFQNYLEGNEMDAIAHTPGFNYGKASKHSFDPSSIIARSGIEVIALENSPAHSAPEKVYTEKRMHEHMIASA